MVDVALLPGEYAVCRLPADATLRPVLWGDLGGDEVISVSWSADGISVICPASRAPAEAETDWRCLRVVGPLGRPVTGTLAALVTPLAEARVNVVAFSTYDTDHVLVPAVRLDEATAALRRVGHRLVD